MDMKEFVIGTHGTMYYVSDMKKSVAYYKMLYGKEPLFESPDWTEFDLNGTHLCLHIAEDSSKIDGKGTLIHKVRNLKEMIPSLKQMGVEIERDYHEVCEGGFSVDFRDPSGNRLSLFEYLG